MNKIRRTPSGRGALDALFALFARFTDHRMTCAGFGMKAFGPSWRFSAWLRWASGCPQLGQKGGHGPSHLCQGEFRSSVFPRSIASLNQRTSQDQQIVRTGNHLSPEFRALRSTQPRDIPEQFLFVKAIAMLVRIAQAIRRANLSQRNRAIPVPDKPTDS